MATKGPQSKEAARVRKSDSEAPTSSARDLFRWIAERGQRIPAEERKNIPSDGAMYVDHYLYGTPKESR